MSDCKSYSVARIEARPGDLFVVKCHDRLPSDVLDAIRNAFGAKLPKGVHLLVIDVSVDLSVIGMPMIAAPASGGSAA